MGKTNKELNCKQEKFVREYMKDFNGKQAAIRAGYTERSSEVTASNLLSHYKVKKYIAELRGKIDEKVQITAVDLVNDLIEIKRRAMGGKFTLGEGILAETITDYDPKAATKAIELIGKHIGAFTEKVDHSGGITITFNNKSKPK